MVFAQKRFLTPLIICLLAAVVAQGVLAEDAGQPTQPTHSAPAGVDGGPRAAEVVNPLDGNAHGHTVEGVVAGWRKRQAVPAVKLSWQLDKTGPARFARHHNNWATDKEDRPRVLDIRGEQVRYAHDEFETAAFNLAQGRVLTRRQRFDPGNPFVQVQSSHQRFNEAADARFPSPDVEYRDPCRLTVLIDGNQRTTRWEPQEPDLARGLISQLPPYGEAASIFGHLHLDGLDSLDALDVLAPLLVYRPLSPNPCGVKAENCTLDEKTMLVRGKECVVVREQLDAEKKLRRSYWCDPARDFLILRYIGEGEAHEEAQLDITYAERPGQGWAPTEWTAICTHKQAFVIDRFVRSVVAELTLGQDAAGGLSVDFSPGTWVIDEPDDSEFVVRSDSRREAVEIPEKGKIKAQFEEVADEAKLLHVAWQTEERTRQSQSRTMKTCLAGLVAVAIIVCLTLLREPLATVVSRGAR